MVDTILAFCTRLLQLRVEGSAFFPNDTHRVTVEELTNGNARFSAATFIAGEWHAMGSYEIEVGQCHFWTRVVEALRLYCGATFAIPDGLVSSVAYDLAGADLLTQERVREEQVLPKRKITAGGKNPGFTGTIKSSGRTKTRVI